MRKLFNQKIATKISLSVLFTLIVGLVTLWYITNTNMTNAMMQSAKDRLDEATQARAVIIEQYLDSVQLYFESFAKSDTVKEVLENPTDKDAIARAQAYTELYAQGQDNLEGLSINATDYPSLCNVSKNQSGAQSFNDPDSSLPEADASDADVPEADASDTDAPDANGSSRPKIITSPFTGEQVITFSPAVTDDSGNTLGTIGGGFYATNLLNQLNDLTFTGLDSCKYQLLDIDNNNYVLSSDETLLGATVENNNYLNLMAQISNDPSTTLGNYFYTDEETGEDIIATYKYMEDYNWVFIIETEKDEVSASVNALSRTLLIISLIILMAVGFISILTIRYISKGLVNLGNIIAEIGTLDLTKASQLKKYCNRKDEIGIIANATDKLVEAINDAVTKLKEKGNILFSTSEELLNMTNQTQESVNQVDTAITEIAEGASNQAQETQKASDNVLSIGTKISDTAAETSSMHDTASSMMESSNKVMEVLDELNTINGTATQSIDIISEQTNTTNESALKIQEATNLITSISEETNLLSLNASIEAARAGEQGRGFAVVASQIQKLADESKNSATQIESIINLLLSDSDKAVKSMEEVKVIMNKQSEYVQKTKSIFNDVKKGIDDTITGVDNIASKTNEMDASRATVIDVVQNLSAIAEENAASAEETSASTTIVNQLMTKMSTSATQLADIADEMEQSISIFKTEE